MPRNVAQKLIASHLVDGPMVPGEEVSLRMDQTLTQDATGTMVMLELEAMGLERVKTEVSAQYVDHNLLQTDFRNPDDHVFLRSACQRFGIHFAGPGVGVSHPVHMERFGRPGVTLAGSDSHTPAAGSLGMFAVGAGGLEVALAMAGEPLVLRMPEVWGVGLTGKLPDWVSAKDVVLDMLRRHGVDGGLGRVVEYHGPGLAGLSAMDRHVIANMGTELGATTTVFPADDAVRRFMASHGRGDAFSELSADEGAAYDVEEEIDLGSLEPLIAKPSSPGNVVPVADVAGTEIYQAYLGSSANPGFRDFAVPARMLDGRRAAPGVSLDVNPTSRRMLDQLIDSGDLGHLVRAGARLHQVGCNGCIGMGQAPASGRPSVRTVPRNFPGRSGTKEDAVYLASPETTTASALRGVLTDPRDLGVPYARVEEPARYRTEPDLIEPPPSGVRPSLVMGPNIKPLPGFGPLPDSFEAPVLLKLGDDVSTDEILPAGQRVLPYRSNLPAISAFAFSAFADDFERTARATSATGFVVVAGRNYGQGSSREHAAMAPRHLGLRVVLAKSFARIHRQNLVNFGMLPLTFLDPADHERIGQGDALRLSGWRRAISQAAVVGLVHVPTGRTIEATHDLTARDLTMLNAGSLLDLHRKKGAGAAPG